MILGSTLVSPSSPASPFSFYDASVNPGWFDYLGLLLTVAGFVVAFVQLARTRSAATAATRALGQAQRALAGNQLLLVSPQLHDVVSELDFATDQGNRDVARLALVRFSRLAKEASELLGHVAGDHATLVMTLDTTVTEALNVKERVVTTTTPLTRLTKDIGTQISAVSADVHGVATALRNQIGSQDVH